MHPVFTTAHEISADAPPALRPILFPSWAVPGHKPHRPALSRDGALDARGDDTARFHGVAGAFV